VSTTNSSTIRITNSEHPNERLDRFIQLKSEIGSRSKVIELIDTGMVTVNGSIKKPSYKTQVGDIIICKIPAPESSEIKALDLPLDIIFEDDECLVILKPSGLVMHPAAGHKEDTLVNILAHHRPNLRASLGEIRPGIVHRLDKETSGLVVVAKTPKALEHIAKQFKDRTVHRRYYAVTSGLFKNEEGKIQNYLARHPNNRKKFSSHLRSSLGKLAITNYKVLKSSKKGFSLVECKLETGRTHQIRVHLSEMGHYILGDNLYGAKLSKDPSGISWGHRIALHAFELGFNSPQSGDVIFKAPWPDPYNQLIEDLPWT
jgi:23S rRNA pseudouridine1911/1915/1917 synthase